MRLLITNACLAIVMATCEWLAAQQIPDAIPLREMIVMDHQGPVLLSDLLPSNAPVAMREATRNVELCPVPQAGSLRILRAEQLGHSINSRTLLQRLIIPSQVTIRYSSVPSIEGSVRDAISDFLRKHGWPGGLPDGAELNLPEVSAADEKSVEVMDLRWDLQRQAMEVRLGCPTPRSCGGFLGYVLLPQTLPEDSRNGLIRVLSARSGQPLRTVIAEAAHPPLVAKGKAATLILEDANMRISVPVICLEPGLLNEEIRVLDRRSRRVFLAQVIGDHLLRATL